MRKCRPRTVGVQMNFEFIEIVSHLQSFFQSKGVIKRCQPCRFSPHINSSMHLVFFVGGQAHHIGLLRRFVRDTDLKYCFRSSSRRIDELHGFIVFQKVTEWDEMSFVEEQVDRKPLSIPGKVHPEVTNSAGWVAGYLSAGQVEPFFSRLDEN